VYFDLEATGLKSAGTIIFSSEYLGYARYEFDYDEKYQK
jgi:uncharacterized protein YprB with RNaseH-like and TPR domain